MIFNGLQSSLGWAEAVGPAVESRGQQSHDTGLEKEDVLSFYAQNKKVFLVTKNRRVGYEMYNLLNMS